MAQIALKWVLNQKGVVAPIVGSTNPSQLEDLVGTFKVCSKKRVYVLINTRS
jgi:aryl-alcohol dehydrogenase-like predicted oxidoreductase